MKISSLKSKIKKLEKELKESESKIIEIKKILQKLSPKQKDRFNLIYSSFPDIKVESIPHCLSSCQSAIEKNKESQIKLKNKLGKYLDEFYKEFPKAKNWIVDFSKEIETFLENKAKILKEEKDQQFQKNFTNNLTKVKKEDQVDIQSFSSEKEAREFYEDEYHEFFDCGQGYFQNEAIVECFIENCFFKVTLLAEIWSSKQDIGDRLYWVENLDSITFYPQDFKEYKKELQKKKENIIKEKEQELKNLKAEL